MRWWASTEYYRRSRNPLTAHMGRDSLHEVRLLASRGLSVRQLGPPLGTEALVAAEKTCDYVSCKKEKMRFMHASPSAA